MTQQIRLWEITRDQTLAEIKGSQIPLEENLEDWLESDISILDSNLLVIGRQVSTDFGGIIDLLCIDDSGDLVVVELKKAGLHVKLLLRHLTTHLDQRPFIAANYRDSGRISGDRGTLDVAFQDEFDQELPETLNASHRSLIVAETLDASSERIVRYLSELNVPINVLTVQQFQDSTGRRMLAQVYLVEPEVATQRARSQSKRTSYSVERLHNIARENGIGDLYGDIRTGVRGILTASAYRHDYVAYNAKRKDGSIGTVMSINTSPRNQEGGLAFNIHATRFESILGIKFETLKKCLPNNTREAPLPWRNRSGDTEQDSTGLEGAFQTRVEVQRFITLLKQGATS